MSTQIGAQASNDQYEKILSYLDIGKKEGAKISPAARRTSWAENWRAGTTSSPRYSKGTTKCACPRGIFGLSFRSPYSTLRSRRWRSPTTHCTGWIRIWSATSNTRTVRQGHQKPAACGPLLPRYPAHAAFRYKKSGIGRETHKMMWIIPADEKLLVSYSDKRSASSRAQRNLRTAREQRHSLGIGRVGVTTRPQLMSSSRRRTPHHVHQSAAAATAATHVLPVANSNWEASMKRSAKSPAAKSGWIGTVKLWRIRAGRSMWLRTRASFSLEAPLNLRFLIAPRSAPRPTPRPLVFACAADAPRGGSQSARRRLR